MVHVAYGQPEEYLVTAGCSANNDSRGRMVDFAVSPRGSIGTLLCEHQVQFWATRKFWMLLTSLPFPPNTSTSGGISPRKVAGATQPASAGAGAAGGGGGSGSGNAEAVAVAQVWHPIGRTFAIALSDRRVLFLEADIVAANEGAVIIEKSTESVRCVNSANRVCIAFDAHISSGLITGLGTTSNVVLATTSAGFVVSLSWSTGSVLHCWNATFLLQRPLPTALPSSTAVGGGASSSSGSPLGAASAGPAGHARTSSATGGMPIVGGAVTFFTFSTRMQCGCILLADGTASLIRPTTTDFTAKELSFTSNSFPNINAVSVALNATHNVAAMAMSNGNVKFHEVDVDQLRLSPFVPRRSEQWVESFDLFCGVRSMAWSNDGECLCVAFPNRGAAIFTVAGACVLSTFPRFTPEGRVPPYRPVMPDGCHFSTWDAESNHLVCGHRDGASLISLKILRTATRVDPNPSGGPIFSAIALFDSEAIHLHHLTESAGALDGWEVVRISEEYAADNSPVKFCSVSSDGSQVVVAGAQGCVLYNRNVRRWRLFGDKRQEANLVCVCPPCWIHNLVVALPVRNKAKQCFELMLFPRFHLDGSSLLASIPLQKRPLHVQACPAISGSPHWLLMVIDSSGALFVFDVLVKCDISATHAVLDVVQRAAVQLPTNCHNCLTASICSPGKPFPLRGTSTPVAPSPNPLSRELCMPRVLLLRTDHRLISFDIEEGDMTVIQSGVTCFWVDAKSSSSQPHLDIVVSSGLAGVHVHHLPTNAKAASTPTAAGTTGRLTPTGVAAAVPTQRPLKLLVSDFDSEGAPIGIQSSDGLVVTVAEGISRKLLFPTLSPFFQVNVKPLLYQHKVLLPLFISRIGEGSGGDSYYAVSESLIPSIISGLREHGSFVNTADYLLHSVLHDERDYSTSTATGAAVAALASSTLPGAGAGGGGGGGGAATPGSGAAAGNVIRCTPQRVLQVILAQLRRYAEYFEIIVGVIRKSDVSKWKPLFDVIGSAHDFFADCVTHNRIEEAVHIVRVILAERPDDANAALQEASLSAKKLLFIVLTQKGYATAHEILRFIARLVFEIDLPAAEVAPPASAIERALRSMWPLTSGTGSEVVLPKQKIKKTTFSLKKTPSGNPVTSGTDRARFVASNATTSGAEHDGVVSQVLRKYPELHDHMEKHAVQLLRDGHLSHLCTFFQVFDLDLSRLITMVWPMNSASLTPKFVVLRVLFDAVHREFALPRCFNGPLMIENHHQVTTRRTVGAVEPEDEQAFVMQEMLARNPLGFITVTQEHLAVASEARNALVALLKMFHIHDCDEYVICLSIIALQIETLLSVFRDASQPLRLQVIELLSAPENAGYGPLLRTLKNFPPPSTPKDTPTAPSPSTASNCSPISSPCQDTRRQQMADADI